MTTDHRITTTKAALVDLRQFWIPLAEQKPPIGPKLLLIHRDSGVARIDRYSHQAWATHWCGLPKFKD